MRCLECNKGIEMHAYDPDLTLCNSHYLKYLDFLEETLPDQDRIKQLRLALRPFNDLLEKSKRVRKSKRRDFNEKDL